MEPQCGVCRKSVPPAGFAMTWLETRAVVMLSGGNSPSVPNRVYEEAVPASDRCSDELMGIAGQNELCGTRDVEWDEAHFPLLRAS